MGKYKRNYHALQKGLISDWLSPDPTSDDVGLIAIDVRLVANSERISHSKRP